MREDPSLWSWSMSNLLCHIIDDLRQRNFSSLAKPPTFRPRLGSTATSDDFRKTSPDVFVSRGEKGSLSDDARVSVHSAPPKRFRTLSAYRPHVPTVAVLILIHFDLPSKMPSLTHRYPNLPRGICHTQPKLRPPTPCRVTTSIRRYNESLIRQFSDTVIFFAVMVPKRHRRIRTAD